MAVETYDVVIIGAGPGGYVCALRAAQLGLRVACVEKDASLGGTCLNVGCIPSKALLESTERLVATREALEEHGVTVGEVGFELDKMMARKAAIVARLTGGIGALFKSKGVALVPGLGIIRDESTVVVRQEDGETLLETRAIVIATGSAPTALPGVAFDGDRVGSSTDALSYAEVPRHLVVVGAGVIGLELGSVWRRLGARVTVLEYLDRILPGLDLELAKEARKILKKQGIGFELGARVTGAEVRAAEVVLRYEAAKGGAKEIEADRVLVAVGRKPVTAGLGCEAAGITLDDCGRVVVDDSFQTSCPGVFAIGDVIEGPMLAHKAEDEGIAVAEILAGGAGHVNYAAIPSIVYTHPEVASVGPSEEELKASGVPYARGRFRYGANGRAMALGETAGLVKVLAHAETDRLLAVHIIGARAGDLIAEAALAIELGASAEDVARAVHAHPTLSEILREAAMDVAGRALHR